MRIFIGCDEVASIINELAIGFRSLGHDVTTLIKSTHPFYNYSYDYNLDVLSRFMNKRKISSPFFHKSYSAINKILRLIYKSFVTPKIIEQHDLFIFIWSSLNSDYSDLALIKNKNKKIATLFVGSDIRTQCAFQKEFGVDLFSDKKKISEAEFNKKMSWLRVNELFSDAIFSVPDQSGLGIRPYFHFFLPFSCNEYEFRIPNNHIPKVLHAPSRKSIKGTDLIVQTIDRLRENGVSVEFNLLSRVAHSVIKEELRQTDIVVDELILHGPGMLSLEAMASGCALATKHSDRYRKIFNPPICYIDENNIYEQLKKLFTDRQYRLDLASQGRSFVKKYYAASIIADQIIQKVTTSKDMHDYKPTFFLNNYILADNCRISAQNHDLTHQILEKYGISRKTDLQKSKARKLLIKIPKKIKFFD